MTFDHTRATLIRLRQDREAATHRLDLVMSVTRAVIIEARVQGLLLSDIKKLTGLSSRDIGKLTGLSFAPIARMENEDREAGHPAESVACLRRSA